MKKSIALVAFLGSALFSGVAFGQTKTQMSVNLTVNLHPMISIQIDGSNIVDNTGEILTSEGKSIDGSGGKVTEGVAVDSQSEVVIDYKTANDYLNGKGTMKNAHLKLFSTGIYEVAVRANDLLTEGGKKMEANNFKIEAFEASGKSVGTVTLSNTDQKLISGLAGKEQLYNINYQGAGGNVFIDKIIDSKLTTYTTDVIYSISVK